MSIDYPLSGKANTFATIDESILQEASKHRWYLSGYGYAHRNRDKPAYMHKYVAELFIPNPEGYTIVNHKNHNRLDNRVENLEWCDRSHDARHMRAKYGPPTNQPQLKRMRAVIQVDLSGKTKFNWTEGHDMTVDAAVRRACGEEG